MNKEVLRIFFMKQFQNNITFILISYFFVKADSMFHFTK